MKRSRFSEEQIIGILREQEAGCPTPDVCRMHGISGATFYKWKAKFGGLDVSAGANLFAAFVSLSDHDWGKAPGLVRVRPETGHDAQPSA